MAVEFRVLGAVEAYADGRALSIGYAQLRSVLAMLVVEANRPVSVDQIVDQVWAARRLPQRPRRAVHHAMTLLRRALAPAADATIHRRAEGYQLNADPDAVDLHRFNALLDRAGAAARDEQAADLLAQALRLWRGEPFSGLDTAGLNAVRTSLNARRHGARLDLTDIRLRQRQGAGLVAELGTLCEDHPLDERLAGQYLLALYRSGCQAQALEHYERLRRLLAEELGADPDPALQRLHHHILTADPALTLPAVNEPAVPAQLPAPPRTFTGRAAELAALDRALDEPAAAGGTMVISAVGGVGGIGKTWLALLWAHRHLDRFPDGQLYVNLRGFDPTAQPVTAGEAMRGFLYALGVHSDAMPADPDAQAARYRSEVAGKRMLIVLDNAADTDQVVPLLPGSATCTVLVTSRRRLAGLATAHGARLLSLDVLPEPDARHLLAQLLGRSRLEAEPAAVTDLLATCAGLPLAVRIVATRAQQHPDFPLTALAGELRDHSARLDALDTGDLRTNLRAVLSWSLHSLSTSATALFALLGIAPGLDIGLPAAASLADLPEGQTRAVLRELENASLVQQHAPDRYRMHDLIRLYATETARDQLTHEVREAALRRVLDFYLSTAHAAARLLSPKREPTPLDPPASARRAHPLPDFRAALAWFETEHANLLAGQRAAAGHAWHVTVWHVAWLLNPFHYRRGYQHAQLPMWQAALDAATLLRDYGLLTIASRTVGRICAEQGRFEEAIGHLHRALVSAEERRNQHEQAYVHMDLGWARGEMGDHRRALWHATCARDLYHALGQTGMHAHALNLMGWSAAELGEYDTARAHCRAALGTHRTLRQLAGKADVLDSLGYIDHLSGRYRQAVRQYRQALTLLRAFGHTLEATNTLDRLGRSHAALGEHAQARGIWLEALLSYRQMGRTIDVTRIQQQLDEYEYAA